MKKFLQCDLRFSRKLGYSSLLLIFAALFLGTINRTSQAAIVFTDNFNDGSINMSLWKFGVLTRASTGFDSQVSVTESNGRRTITQLGKTGGANYNGYVSVQRLNITGGFASVRVEQKASFTAETIFSIGIDSNNFYRFRGRGTTLYLETVINGSLSSTSIKSTSDPRFWRFRHNPSTNAIVFETSANSTSWEVRRTVARSIDISN
ncbi:MAG: hypothetical protein JWN60_1335, partial [Acidobacteria bacterium]|nr:hypothetical protein [Acidobacteriota bacterium]